ncbi:MAG: hypothetical protein Q8P40_13570 [Nitrospirota bacterium]|nr:hypothetical protein [Nitrospirota bacterium]
MPQHENKSEIIEPDASIYVTLDDISQKFTKLLKTQAEILKTASRDQKLLSSILKELQDEADEGEYIRREATANPNTFDVLDFLAILGSPVKGYFIKNDGANTILHGHNITNLSIDSNINTVDARFSSLLSTEESRVVYNRNKIKNVYIKSVAGNSAYRVKVVW